MTRARDELHLMLPQRFHVHGQHRLGDRHVYSTRSRFIADRILDRFDRTFWPETPAQPGRPAKRTAPGVDLEARMRAMWE
jgi:DNA helicase-2/ATP-dependent DNA helicase PcrA